MNREDISMDYIDHTYTDNIVCPYCGREHEAHGDDGSGGDFECVRCGRRFFWEANYSVTYCSQKEEVRLHAEISQWKTMVKHYKDLDRKGDAEVYQKYAEDAEARLAELDALEKMEGK